MASPMVLIILDGWGYSQNLKYNAIAAAKTPCWDQIIHSRPYSLVECGGLQVGLPEGQMGNSEVGHMTIGAGRIIYQDLTRINLSIEDRTFFDNVAFKSAISNAKNNNKQLHIMGLLSSGGVHSHENHLFALLEMAKLSSLINVCIHVFLDGRDVSPKSAKSSLDKLEMRIKEFGIGRIVSISGRYYAMDRDKRYDRTEKVYNLLTKGESEFYANSAIEALNQAYSRGETDEFVKPTIITDKKNHANQISINFQKSALAGKATHKNVNVESHYDVNDNQACMIDDGDSVIFFNFRTDRTRQLSYALTDKKFSGFKRDKFPAIGCFVTMTQYADDIKSTIAFPKQKVSNSLGEVLSESNLRQLRLAETEKYAHVTFFFNGGQDIQFEGEERILIPSPKVATYDLKPEMSAIELTDKLIEAIKNKQYDFIVCNYANADMVGHTGDFKAAVKAVEILDKCLARIVKAIEEADGQAIITADHGNVETMYDSVAEQPHTAHTKNLVPCVYIGNNKVKINLPESELQDIAPTILELMELSKPGEMTGKSIFEFTK